MHPLLAVLLDAADGRFPPADGAVTYLPPLAGGWEAVVSLTGHAFLATRLTDSELADLRPDGYGAALHPEVQLRMAGAQNGQGVGVVDVLMAARGRGGGQLRPNPDLATHPRVAYAHQRRRDVRAYGASDGLVTVGTGLAGQREISVEVSGGSAVRGRDLIELALTMVPATEVVFAAVSPGNARSLRAFLHCGFTPIGSEVLIRPASSLR